MESIKINCNLTFESYSDLEELLDSIKRSEDSEEGMCLGISILRDLILILEYKYAPNGFTLKTPKIKINSIKVKDKWKNIYKDKKNEN